RCTTTNIGARRKPPLLASKPETTPMLAATRNSRVRYAPGSTATSCGSPGQSRNLTPSVTTMSSVTVTRTLPPIHRVAYAPAAAAGTPTAALRPTTRQSMRRSRQYAYDALSVDGIVAGRGEATAAIGGIPTTLSSGVAIAEPPLPNRPPSSPTAAPITATARTCSPLTSDGQSTRAPRLDWTSERATSPRDRYDKCHRLTLWRSARSSTWSGSSSTVASPVPPTPS